MFSFFKNKNTHENPQSSESGCTKKLQQPSTFSGYSEKRILSPLAIDNKGFTTKLRDLLERGFVNDLEAEQLLNFHKHGYCVLELDESEEFFSQFMSEVETVWQTPPNNLLGSGPDVPGGKLVSVADMKAASNGVNYRSPGSRIIDLHSHSETAKKIYLNPKIHKLIDIILEQKCVATQSLYFEYGSTQALHRDPWFVVTRPIHNLVACWVALEDISEDSGPLSYISGSHTWPFLSDEEDNIILHAPSADNEFKKEVYRHLNSLSDKSSSKAEIFTAKKGQVFIWHGALVHGGTPVKNPMSTRKSFVVHFDAKETAGPRGSRFISNGQEKVVYTKELEVIGRCSGFKNPLCT